MVSFNRHVIPFNYNILDTPKVIDAYSGTALSTAIYALMCIIHVGIMQAYQRLQTTSLIFQIHLLTMRDVGK